MPVFNYELLRQQLERHEGRRAVAYQDTLGHWTVGVGHNLEVPLSDAVITLIYMDDVHGCLTALDTQLPWWRTLDDVRQRVLIDMCFNVGIAKLAGFKRFLDAVQRRDWVQASVEMLGSRWATQVKGRAVTLAAMMRTGQEPDETRRQT